tara:strand:- start:1255 stop:1464 length:210 start_codon:yes stop_codon:yes gene_type:complete
MSKKIKLHEWAMILGGAAFVAGLMEALGRINHRLVVNYWMQEDKFTYKLVPPFEHSVITEPQEENDIQP